MRTLVLTALALLLASTAFGVGSRPDLGLNPDARAFICFQDPPTGDGVYVHRTETVSGLVNTYLMVDCFGEGSGMKTISLKWTTTGFGMAFTPVFYLPGAQQIGGPDHASNLWVVAGNACVYPNEFGWVKVLNQPYFVTGAGTITLSGNTVDGQMIVDCQENPQTNQFCVLGNGGLGMDPPAGAAECECGVPVEAQTWGSIKALYR